MTVLESIVKDLETLPASQLTEVANYVSHLNPERRPRLVRTDSEVERRFKELLQTWRQDTAFDSVVPRVMRHPAFRGIAGLGPQAVPLILRELEQRDGDVLLAQVLEDITGENPVPPERRSYGQMVVADWLAWGKSNGLV